MLFSIFAISNDDILTTQQVKLLQLTKKKWFPPSQTLQYLHCKGYDLHISSNNVNMLIS
jgi:hypothetical protein